MADNDPIIIGQGNTETNETSLSRNEVTAGTVFFAQNQNVGDGIHAEASGGTAVLGRSTDSIGVVGRSTNSFGVVGRTTNLDGVIGTSESGVGVSASSNTSTGVVGHSTRGDGVIGQAVGFNPDPEGHPELSRQIGVKGLSDARFGAGVSGLGRDADFGTGVVGIGAAGVFGLGAAEISHSTGVSARGQMHGVYADSALGTGVKGSTISGTAVLGQVDDPVAGKAGVFEGDVEIKPVRAVGGKLTVTPGRKNFKIDHPLDPENRYLLHTCVESSEMKNVYDGVAHLDEEGAAWVELPEWFEALNGDFRYQLTAVGGSAPDLHVAEEISENRFKIAGGQGGMKVCWQVTGTRKDPWAAANPFVVEEEKPEEERGRYLEPSLYDAPEERRIRLGPPEPPDIEEARRRQVEQLRRLEEEQRREMDELRQRMERQEEEEPPEST